MTRKTKSTEDLYKLVCHDSLSWLAGLATESAHLVIADPPFNYGQDYGDAKVNDKKTTEEYLQWSGRWLQLVKLVLHRHGTFWLFVPDEWVTDLDHYIRHTLELHRQSWVVWAYGFGVACQKNFSRSHTHILRYTRTKGRFTFNAHAVRVPSDRQLIYKDKRANPKGKLPNATWVLHRHEIEQHLNGDKDTWYQSRICGTFHERDRNTPNQIPVPLMDRIVLATSNPGDLVLDPFCGTCSSGIAAARHGRRYLGCDIRQAAITTGEKRIDAALAAQR